MLTVIARTDKAVYMRLPREWQKPIDGCDCPYCKTHPDEKPTWDTLATPVEPLSRTQQYAWTVHMPDPKAFQKAVARKAVSRG